MTNKKRMRKGQKKSKKKEEKNKNKELKSNYTEGSAEEKNK